MSDFTIDLETVIDPSTGDPVPVTTIHDESDGLQNTPPILDSTTDENGNDIALDLDGTNNDVPDFPSDFATRLSALGADVSGAIGAALSGYDGSNDGLNVITIADPNGFGIDNLAFTQAGGEPFPTYDPDATDPPFDPTTGVDSELDAVDGGSIYLFVDATDDNIVYGIDEDGHMVLAVYLDDSGSTDLTSAKIWTVQFEPILHPDITDPDDPVNLTNKLFVTASRDLEFDLTNAPSGQNLFIMFGDGEIGIDHDDDPTTISIVDPDEVAIVATGRDPLNQSDSSDAITSANTVNTSQQDVTSFGVDNQQLDPDEGIYFTFVRGPNPEYTVSPDDWRLDQNEADIEANIQFLGLVGAKAAQFQVVQTTSGTTARLQVTALIETDTSDPLDPADPSGVNFVDELGNDPSTNITKVVISGTTKQGNQQIPFTVTFEEGAAIPSETFGLSVDFDGDGVIIDGVPDNTTIQYFTEGNHNRVLIENIGDGKGQDSASVDIGAFELIQGDFTTAEVGSTVHFEDDGPALGLLPPAINDVYLFDGNTTLDGNFEGNNGTDLPEGDALADQDPTSVTINLPDLFQVDSGATTDGTDGASISRTYSLEVTFDTSDLFMDPVMVDYPDNLGDPFQATSGGVPIVWKEVIAGYAGVINLGETDETEIFSISVDSTGTVTFSQSGVLDHVRADDADDPSLDGFSTDTLFLAGGQINGEQRTTITDEDGDSHFIDSTVDLTIFHIGDDGPSVDVDVNDSGIVLTTADGATPGGNFTPTGVTGTDSADFSGEFTAVADAAATSLYGADNAGLNAANQDNVAWQYELVIDVGTGDSGLDSGGQSIILDYGDDGSGGDDTQVVIGSVGTTEVFRVSVDDDGNVTLLQSQEIDHPTPGATSNYTDQVLALATGVLSLKATATVTDYDSDTATDFGTLDLGGNLKFADDGPKVDFSNLVGTVTTTPQIGFWDGPAGADDQTSTLAIAAVDSDPEADGINFDMVTADGIASTGTVTFDPDTGTGTLTADFDNDPDSGVDGNETIGFSLTVNENGTYEFELDEVAVPVVTLSTDEGQLPAGGPDPVQTLSFDSTSIVFFAVDADSAEDTPEVEDFGPVDILPAILLGDFDLTEAELQARSAMVNIDGTGIDGSGEFAFIRDEIEMNVSTTGIGVGNNVFQGYDPLGGTDGSIDPFNPGDLPEFDESFVINPEPLASSVKVYISKTAGGFLPPDEYGVPQTGATPAKTDYLYYNVYDELGNFTDPILVTSDMVFDEAGPGGTGENLWSFNIDIDDVTIDGNFIDAMQFTMGFGDIKIPKIEVVVRGDEPPNDIFLDFSATLTDADGDSATTDFSIDLVGNDVDPAPYDYTLVGSDDTADAFDVDVLVAGDYLIQGFDPVPTDPSDDELYDQLYLLNGTGGYTLNTGDDLGVGTFAPDSEVIVDGVTVIVEDATLSGDDITIA